MKTQTANKFTGLKITKIFLLALFTFTIATSARQVLAVTMDRPSYRVAKPDELIQTVMLEDGGKQCVGLVEEEGTVNAFWPTSNWEVFSTTAYNVVPYPTKTYYAPAASAPDSWHWPCSALNYQMREVTAHSSYFGPNATQGTVSHDTAGQATICQSGESLGEPYFRKNNVPISAPTRIQSWCDYELSGFRVNAQQQACSLVYHGTRYNYSELAEVRDAAGTLHVVTVRTEHRPPRNNECPDLSAVDGPTIPIDIKQPVRGIYDEQRDVFTALEKDLTSAETCEKLGYTNLSDSGTVIAQIKARAQEEARRGSIRDRNNTIITWAIIIAVLAVISLLAFKIIRHVVQLRRKFRQDQATGREFWIRLIIASFVILMMLLMVWSIAVFVFRKTA